MSDFTVGIRLTADGKDLVGAVRQSKEEIDKLGQSTGRAASEAAALNAQQKGLADSLAAQTSAMARASSEVQKVLARYDPLGAKLRSLQSDFAALNEAAKNGAFGQALDPVVDLSYKKINEEIGRTKGLMVQAGAAGAENFGMMSGGAIASSFATAQARRELIVLGHEAMTGNFSRMPGSFMVLAERIGISGGAMTSVLLPLAAIGVVMGTVIKAFVGGAREMHEMDNALAMTSGYAGLTRGTMRELAQSVSDAGTLTIGTSKQIVTQLVASGKIGAQSIGAVAKLADDYANATGRDIDKIMPELIKMFENPAKGAETLNKSMHALSPEFLEQIAHLERIGELDEAQRLTAEKLSPLLTKHKDQLGYLESAWDATKKAASSAWDAMLGLGRPQTVEEALAKAQEAVDRQRTRLNYSPNRAAANVQAAQAVSYDASIMVNEAQAEAWQRGQNARDNQLQNSIALVAKQGSEYAKIRALQDEIEKLGKSTITDDNLAVDVTRKIANDQREIMNIRRSIGAQARALSDGQIADATKLFEIQNKQAAEESDSQLKLGMISRQQHDQEIYNLAIEDIARKKSDEEQKLAIGYRTAQEKQTFKNRIEALNAEAIARTQAYNNQGLIAANALLVAQAAADASASQATTDMQLKAIAGYDSEIAKLREHNAEIGKTKEQIDLLKAAEIDRDINRLNTDIAIALSDGNNSEAARHYVDLVEEQIKLLKEKQGLLREGAVLEAGAAAVKKETEEFKRMNLEIRRGLTDALMRGFESGKDFARNFRDTLVNMFKTAILRPVIQWAVSPISGAITATLGSLGISRLANAAGVAGGAAGSSGIGSMLSGGSSLTGAANFVTGGFDSIFQSAGVKLGSQWIADIGNNGFGLPFISGLVMAATGNVAGGIGSTLGGIAGSYFGPIGTMVGSALGGYIGSMFGGGGGTPTSALPDVANNLLLNLNAQYATIISALGGTAGNPGFVTGANTGGGGVDPQFAIRSNIGGHVFDAGGFGGAENPLNDTNLRLASSRAILNALQGSELPQYLSKVFNLVVAENASQADIDNVLAFAGSLKTIREQLLETRAPAEIAAANVTSLNTTLGASATSIEAWKTQFVAAIDAGINPQTLAKWQALGQVIQQATDAAAQAAAQAAQAQQQVMGDARSTLMDAYNRESSALTQTRDQMLGFVESLKAFRDGLLLGALSPLSPEAKYAESRRQFEDVSRRAQLGDIAAMEQLQGSSQSFLDASRGYNASNTQYAADFAAVMAVAGSAQSVAERQASIATAQLDVMRGQLTALNLLNSTMTSFAQALSAYANLAGVPGVSAGAIGGVRSPVNEYGSHTGIGDAGYRISGDTLYFPGGGSHSISGVDAAATLIATYGLVATPAGGYMRTRAKGGFTPPGWTLAGEMGPELVNFSAPSRVYTAEETRAALAGGDNKELTALLRDVLVELREVRVELRAANTQRAAVCTETVTHLERVEQHAERTARTLSRVVSV